MEFDERMPIYIQIINSIKKDIIAGKIKGGEKLASMREMAERYKVNPNTMQRVYQELEKDGITYTQRGMGTFITEDAAKVELIKLSAAGELIETFINGMRGLGFGSDEIKKYISDYLSKGEM